MKFSHSMSGLLAQGACALTRQQPRSFETFNYNASSQLTTLRLPTQWCSEPVNLDLLLLGNLVGG